MGTLGSGHSEFKIFRSWLAFDSHVHVSHTLYSVRKQGCRKDTSMDCRIHNNSQVPATTCLNNVAWRNTRERRFSSPFTRMYVLRSLRVLGPVHSEISTRELWSIRLSSFASESYHSSLRCVLQNTHFRRWSMTVWQPPRISSFLNAKDCIASHSGAWLVTFKWKLAEFLWLWQ